MDIDSEGLAPSSGWQEDVEGDKNRYGPEGPGLASAAFAGRKGKTGTTPASATVSAPRKATSCWTKQRTLLSWFVFLSPAYIANAAPEYPHSIKEMKTWLNGRSE